MQSNLYSAAISKDECLILNDILGPETTAGCGSLHHDMDDNFTTPGADKFQGRDSTHHRNSWLMPKMARRMTRNNKCKFDCLNLLISFVSCQSVELEVNAYLCNI